MIFEDDEPMGEQAEVVEYPLTFPQTTTHRWRARGQEVFCVQCSNPHGFTLRVGTHLVGESEDGKPLFATVFDVPAEGQPSTELSSSGDDKSL